MAVDVGIPASCVWGSAEFRDRQNQEIWAGNFCVLVKLPMLGPLLNFPTYRVDSNLAKAQLNINSKALVAHISTV